MSEEKFKENLFVGATTLMGILGTLSTMLRLNRFPKWRDQAKEAANINLEKGEKVNKNFMLGGIAGGLIGAATALLLAPKAGYDLVKDLFLHFSHGKEHTPADSAKSTPLKTGSRRGASKKASRSVKKALPIEKPLKIAERVAPKSPVKRKTPAKRRNATPTPKQSEIEKPESENVQE
jgi:hypothetical protein